MRFYEPGEEVNPFTNVIASSAPAWALEGGCHQDGCDHGVLLMPDAGRILPLFLRDAVLNSFGEVAWCGCPFGVARREHAERVWRRILTNGDSTAGEYLSPEVVRDVRKECDRWLAEQESAPMPVEVVEAVGMTRAQALAVLRGDDEPLPF
jgi:hypothetical protein